MINEETQRRIKALENDGNDKSKKSPRGHKKKHEDDTDINMDRSTEEPSPINGTNEHSNENGVATTNGHHDNESGHEINGNGHELTTNGDDHNDDN